MRVETLVIVGVGLIGGSIGLASKRRGLVKRVIGVGRDERKLARAAENGTLDEFSTHLTQAVANADLVIVCTPVDRIADDVQAIAQAAPRHAVITDAGSTKAKIVEALANRLPENGPRFLGSHPLAGSEKTGADHARADLFDGRLVIVTPTPQTDHAALTLVENFWQSLGARTASLSPEEHDRVLARTSHLPHVVAASLAGVTPAEWLDFTAGGFRDTTRIAGGDPHLWTAIVQANQTALLESVQLLTDRLHEFRTLLEANDHEGLVRWLDEAKKVRDALGS